jgi:SP family arabinose:H+ symporter-like MFS transporter
MSNDSLISDTTRESTGVAYVFIVSLVAAFGGFLFGYDLHVIVGGQLFWRPYFHLSDQGYGFAMASAMIGCICGPSLGPWTIDRFGRRSTLMFCALLFAISAVGTALPRDIVTFVIFRIIGGIAIGLASVASPMYIAEIAPARLRGRLGLMFQMAVTLGATASVLVCWWLSKAIGPETNWRYMFGSALVPTAVFFFLLFLVPRSPRWLAEQGRFDEAEKILTRINGPTIAHQEMSAIRADLMQEEGTWGELIRGGMKWALISACLLAVFNNLTGWSGVAYYMPEIFKRGGYDDPSQAIFNSLILNLFNMLFTLICISLVDKFGRRPLWNWTSVLMIGALAFDAYAFHAGWTGSVIILVIILTTIPHHLGLGPLPWLMQSELFPTRLRAKGVCISTTVVWMGGFLSAYLFPMVAAWSERLIGSIALFFVIFILMCVLSLVFGLTLLPETKNRTLEDIAASWDKTSS